MRQKETGGASEREVGGASVIGFDRWRGDPEARRLIDIVASARGVPGLLLVHPSRCAAQVAETRQLAMYLMHVVLGRSLTAIGRSFGRDRTTVAHACARIEDQRDCPDFDDEVARIEALVERGEGEAESEARRVAS